MLQDDVIIKKESEGGVDEITAIQCATAKCVTPPPPEKMIITTLEEEEEEITEQIDENMQRQIDHVSLREQQSTYSHLIKNYEITLRGKWVFPILPFATKEYFICHEGDYTTIGARLRVGKTRKDMNKLLIDLQEGVSTEILAMNHLKVDYSPVLSSNPRWGSITRCHLPRLQRPYAKRKKSGMKANDVVVEVIDTPKVIHTHAVVKYFNMERVAPPPPPPTKRH